MHWLAALLLLGLAIQADAETWRFAVIGDTPYSGSERERLPHMLEAIASQGVELAIHVGDFKSGQARCDDATYTDRHAMFDAFPMPFIFVPGDNEWTDCHRVSNGSFDPLERLAALRRLFWPDNRSLGRKKITVEQQSTAWPEHARFRLGPVLFITLNVPGDDNNYGRAPKPRAEFEARNPVVLAWLRDSFSLARREKLTGVVVAMQANPGFRQFSRGLGNPAFKPLLEALREETLSFSGQVLLLHGDTHSHQIDHPLAGGDGQALGHFTRVESYGHPFMGWIRVIVDNEAATLFRIESNPWPDRGVLP